MEQQKLEFTIPASPHHVCPACDYELTGLSENVCPECGIAFTRHDAIARANTIADRRASSWLQDPIPRSAWLTLGIALHVVALSLPLLALRAADAFAFLWFIVSLFMLLLSAAAKLRLDWAWDDALIRFGAFSLLLSFLLQRLFAP